MEWNRYWESRVGSLETKVGWMEKDVEDTGMVQATSADRIDQEIQERKAAETKLQEEFRTKLGGKDGRELDRTVWALVAVALGAGFQGTAQLLQMM